MLGHHGYLRMQEGDVVEGGELLKEATESIAHLTGNHVLRAALLFHLGLFRCDTGRERGRERIYGRRIRNTEILFNKAIAPFEGV